MLTKSELKTELKGLIDELMPKRYYGHEARKNAKQIALKYAKRIAHEQRLADSLWVENRDVTVCPLVTNKE